MKWCVNNTGRYTYPGRLSLVFILYYMIDDLYQNRIPLFSLKSYSVCLLSVCKEITLN